MKDLAKIVCNKGGFVLDGGVVGPNRSDAIYKFEDSAWCDAPDGSREIMAIRHREYPLIGMQFHPESFLSEVGPELLKRFVALRWPE